MSTFTKTLINWGSVSILLLLFFIWHGAFEGPLTDEEIKLYLGRILAQSPQTEAEALELSQMSLDDIERQLTGQQLGSSDGESSADELLQLLDFMRSDDGGPFVMVNLLHLRDSVSSAEDSAAAEFADYNSAVLGFLLPRGSYPLYNGDAAGQSLAIWGIENGEDWSAAGLVRYRSRRVMIEMITSSDFMQSQGNKTSSLAKTIAVPTTPTLVVGSLNLTVVLLLLMIGMVVQSRINRKKRSA
ncbi:MAG: hypothetical protein AAF810_18285 [Cyanobacteria bacterium P01_D01_bin.36]